MKETVRTPPFGLFEQNDAGEVLYSRLQENGNSPNIRESIIGRNFFEEFADCGCENFRPRFRNFIKSRQSVESLQLNWSSELETVTARILMTRGHETGDMRPSDFVILDIRKSSPNGAFMGEQ